MKFKFFITIFFVLIVTAISISAIHFHFFRLERLRLIEINLQQNATLILSSDLTLTKKEFQQRGTGYIEEIIGDDKVNIIVAIYNQNGNLLYQNENAEIFETPNKIPDKYKEWENVETKEYLIKYLTTEDKVQKRIVRVGMVLNQSLLRWKYLSQRVLIFAGVILLVVTIISYFLTSLLFRPVQNLANHVNIMAEKLESGYSNEFESLFQISSQRFGQDEFSTLIKSLYKLSQKISESHNITKKWSAMMAHELKTPLTILKNRVESLVISEKLDEKKMLAVDEEMVRMENIIEDFLQWASFESDPARPELHAVSLKKRCDYIIQNLRHAYPHANIVFEFSPSEDPKIFCHPIHFDQLLTNLVTNGIKYGNADVSVHYTEQSIIVSDQGAGIPDEVLSKLGTPFNHSRVNGEKGFGLGLAWVNTICRKYGWELTIQQKPAQVEIKFSPYF